MKIKYIRDSEIPGKTHIQVEGSKIHAYIGASTHRPGEYFVFTVYSDGDLYAPTSFDAVELGLKLIADAEKKLAR